MSDEELLKSAETDFGNAVDGATDFEMSNLFTQRSIAASLLVIARNSVPVEVNHVVQDLGFEYGS
jgi:hypothetical protein